MDVGTDNVDPEASDSLGTPVRGTLHDFGERFRRYGLPAWATSKGKGTVFRNSHEHALRRSVDGGQPFYRTHHHGGRGPLVVEDRNREKLNDVNVGDVP